MAVVVQMIWTWKIDFNECFQNWNFVNSIKIINCRQKAWHFLDSIPSRVCDRKERFHHQCPKQVCVLSLNGITLRKIYLYLKEQAVSNVFPFINLESGVESVRVFLNISEKSSFRGILKSDKNLMGNGSNYP